MSYIRWGTLLPSGKKSTAYVFGDQDGLVNLGKSERVPYDEIRTLLKASTPEEFQQILMERLNLEPEESEKVCNGLYREYKQGEWEEPGKQKS